MRLLILILISGGGAIGSAWGLSRGGRTAKLGALVGVLALVAVTAATLLLRIGRLTDTGQPATGPFDAHLVVTSYLRMVVGLWGLESLVLVAAAWLLGGLPRLRGLLPATLAAIAGGTVAMASADLTVGAAAAAGTGLASLFVILAAEGPSAVAAGARELRVTLMTGAVLLVAMAVVPLAAQLAFIASGVGLDEATTGASSVAGPATGLVALAVGLAVAARWGMLPFHVRLSRLTDLVPAETLPLLITWTSVPLTVVAFAAVDRLVAPLSLPLDGERTILVLLAAATLAGASLAASVNDDLRHTLAYLVIADAGLLLLAIAALDPAAWGPGRAWVVAMAASKTALGAWAAVIEDRFESRSLPDLRGWMRRSPVLAAALVVITVATFGLPGWVALDARVTLTTGAWGSPWRELLLVAGFLTLPAYLRLAWLGAGRVTSRVDRAAPERIVRRRKPLESLVVEQEGTQGITIVGGEPVAGRTAAAASAARGAAARLRGALGRARSATLERAMSIRAAAGRRAAAGPAAPDPVQDAPTRAAASAPDRAAGPGTVEPGSGRAAFPDTVVGGRRRRGVPAAAATRGAALAAAPGGAATATGPVSPDEPTTGRARVPAGGVGDAAGERPAVSPRGGVRATPGAWARIGAAGSRFATALRRDRTELLSATVLALAILAALASWGALDIASAAAEPAPIILSGPTD